MEIPELRQKFLEYFGGLGYTQLPGASLIPHNDPSVLFTTAGMQQFKDFYQNPSDAPAKKVTTVQPVLRTSDIAEVGDDTHLTSFEMLGNFWFGQSSARAMKERAIKEAWEFVSNVLGVEASRVHATVFAGDSDTSADTDSKEIWEALGVPVKLANRDDNFWGPTGEEGPCGPTTEIYIDNVEVWNLVFNEYYKNRDGGFTKLSDAGLDTGSGLERLAATLQNQDSVWQIEPFKSWVNLIHTNNLKSARVIIDHLRAVVFLVSDSIRPGNKGREYVLRRLIRKAVFLSRGLNTSADWQVLISQIQDFYITPYEHLSSPDEILSVFNQEKEQFERNLNRAAAYLERWLQTHSETDENQITELAFYMYESFGFPKELVTEYLASLGWRVNLAQFEQLFKAHQEVSRAGLEKQFKGGLADHEPQTIKHHTAHHLLLAALRQVLGPTVLQRGSNVTSERLRMDFSFDRKLTDEELRKVEDRVNQKIQEDLPVVSAQMPKEEAIKSGALAEFGQKYGDLVTVYSIGDFSKELCGGPHVERTGQLGRFEILKEEASSQGVRRIKARLI